jgi:hypothetical protein
MATGSFLGRWLLAGSLIVTAGAVPARAALLTVTDCGDTTPGGTAGQLRRLITDAGAGDIIVIPACTITLTGAPDEDANAGGDLDVTKSLILLGAGAGRTILDGGGIDRVLDVNPGGLLGVAVTIAGVTIRNGQRGPIPDGVGGGVRSAGTLAIVDSTVSHNTAVVAFGSACGHGGGIYSTGTLTVVGSTVDNNFCTGIVNTGGHLLITRSTLRDNVGGSVSNGGVAAIVDTTISVPQIPSFMRREPGVHSGGPLLLSHSTIGPVRDPIPPFPPTLGIGTGPTGSLTLASTIVALPCDLAPGTASSRYSLAASPTCGLGGPGDISGVDPLLGPLRVNGGPTATFALLAGSPAIDAGDPAGCPPTDQRGVARPQDGDLTGTAACDIGAFEAQPRFVVTGTGVGGGPHVRGFHPGTGAEVFSLFPFDPGFLGGVRVAVGDVTGDGVPDVVVAAGVGGGPHVRVLDGAALLGGQAVEVTSFFPYDPGFTGGVLVAVGDVDGDGRADIITGTGPGGGPHVRAFDGLTGAPLAGPIASFFPYDPGFTGGAFVAGGP